MGETIFYIYFMTKEEFLSKARKVHGYKYDYINLKDKIVSSDKVEILYKSIIYTQSVSKHINMGRCPEKNTPPKTTKQFILESIKIWGNKYDYSLVEYKNSYKKIKIIYDGVVFEQSPISHLMGGKVESTINYDYFIKKSLEKWGNKYDYSLVEFKNSNEKVKILYNGVVFEQSPSNHLLYSPEKIMRRKNTEIFIRQSQEIHNHKYDYSKTIYKTAKEKVIIVCPIHNEFEQVANSHIMGMGCIKCGYESENHTKESNKSTVDFISESKLIWGNKYDYSLTKYKNSRTKLKIIYDGITYEQLPGSHLKYPVEGFLDQDIFLKKSEKRWGRKYDYSLVEFKNCHTHVKIIYDGIIYEQLPHNHLIYAPEKILRKTQEQFVEQSNKYHDSIYNYDKVVYINDRSKIEIICDKHGSFLQSPSSHLRSGCPHCNESKGEREVSKILKSYNINFDRQKKFPDCKNVFELPFDFYIPSLRILIEFDGIQHFEPIQYFGGLRAFEKLKINDKIKSDYCEDNYIDLIRIRYDQIDSIEKILKDSLENKIKILSRK